MGDASRKGNEIHLESVARKMGNQHISQKNALTICSSRRKTPNLRHCQCDGSIRSNEQDEQEFLSVERITILAAVDGTIAGMFRSKF
jgi:hypothetical protein